MNPFRSISGYLGAICLVALASLLCEAVRSLLHPPNMVMVYLLAVVLAAARLGRRPAILAAGLSVMAFDFLFIPPRFSLRVSDTEYLVTFFALFVVGTVISSLVARIGETVEEVRTQEARTGSMYSLTRDLSAAADIPAIVTALRRGVPAHSGSRLTVFIAGGGGLEPVPGDAGHQPDETSREVARWVQRSGRRAGAGTAAFPDHPSLFLPIRSGAEVTGVMMIEGDPPPDDTLHLLEAFASLAGLALERVLLARQAEEARFLREKSHLEQALLNSISHDLRTPLVTISGVLDSLSAGGESFDGERGRGMIATAAEEAKRLNRFVGGLLDMTRLEAGALTLRPVPCEVEELIGCAVGAVEPRLGDHRIVTAVDRGLPLVAVDVALMVQALVNLLDNALKYSPPASDITISGWCEGAAVLLAVLDSGPGVPAGEEQRIFEKFHRIEVPERTGGTGLGLSIARGIIEAHGGSITAVNRATGGLAVKVRLPQAAGEMASGGDR